MRPIAALLLVIPLAGCFLFASEGEAKVAPRCGDGVLDEFEGCDDGNDVDDDGCDSNCTVAVCGNAVTNAGEECDDGNANEEDGCTTSCRVLPFCGDGVTQDGEICDDGDDEAGDGCDPDCRPSGACPNGEVTEGREACDDGWISERCTPACEAPGCGDGFVTGLEQCDPPDGAGCDAACRFARGCAAVEAAAAENQSIVRLADGRVVVFGGAFDGTLGVEAPAGVLSTPTLLPLPEGFVAAKVAMGWGGEGEQPVTGWVLSTDGRLRSFGRNAFGQRGTGRLGGDPFAAELPGRYRDVAAGLSFTVAIRDDGALVGIGDGRLGILGEAPPSCGAPGPGRCAATGCEDGPACDARCDEGGRFSCVPIELVPEGAVPADGFVALSVGRRHVLALDAEGALWGFGEERFGQLGAGRQAEDPLACPADWESIDVALSARPHRLAWPGANAPRRIAAGERGSFVLDATGSMFGAGTSCGEETIDPGTNASWFPELIRLYLVDAAHAATRPVFVDVATGRSGHALAIASDGRLFTWGVQHRGRLGWSDPDWAEGCTAPNDARSVPLPAGRRVRRISAGTSHSLVVLDDGTLAVFGSNEFGQLGLEVTPREACSDDFVQAFAPAPVRLDVCAALGE